MARSDLIVSLVRASASGDRQGVKSTAEALVADERAKNHHVVADRLEKALSTVAVTPDSLTTSAKISNSGSDLILEVQPRLQLSELSLTLPALEQAKQIVEEHSRADVLRAHGYEPRHKVLLSGPPGNGKTSFAEAIAEALCVPMYVVRYDALVGSYLGETNTRLRALFDYIRTRPCVLFFDEFDAIGKERGDTHETGEIKRVVSFLLMQLDQVPSYVLTIAATNHAELLDRAVWRRFQLRLDFPAPSYRELEVFLSRVVSYWPKKPTLSLHSVVKKLGKISYAEVVEFCHNVRRKQILSLGEVSVDEALKAELKLWATRIKPRGQNGRGTAQDSNST